MFDNRDSISTVDASKNILDKVNEISDNILKTFDLSTIGQNKN